jgi:hypothetical protein
MRCNSGSPDLPADSAGGLSDSSTGAYRSRSDARRADRALSSWSLFISIPRDATVAGLGFYLFTVYTVTTDELVCSCVIKSISPLTVSCRNRKLEWGEWAGKLRGFYSRLISHLL